MEVGHGQGDYSHIFFFVLIFCRLAVRRGFERRWIALHSRLAQYLMKKRKKVSGAVGTKKKSEVDTSHRDFSRLSNRCIRNHGSRANSCSSQSQLLALLISLRFFSVPLFPAMFTWHAQCCCTAASLQ